MNFNFNDEMFGEKLPGEKKAEPVQVKARVRQVEDPDGDAEEQVAVKYFVDFMCLEGSRFTFADFYR